jgi:hypothetical protein
MGNPGDWVPRPRKVFRSFANRYCDEFDAQADVLGASQTDKNRIASLILAFNNAFDLADDPATRTRITIAAEKAARKALTAQMRHVKRVYLDPAFENGLITESQYRAFGLVPRDGTLTPVGNPTSRALLYEVTAVGGFAVRFHFRDEHVEHSQAIPYGCNGCLVYYAYGPEKIEDVAQLIKTKLFTASPARLELPPDAEGQWLSMAPRWQLDKDGVLGPWGDIVHVRVT